MLVIERRDRGSQQRERKGGVDVEYQRIFPALLQPDGLLFQFAGGVQHVAPLFQQHLPGTGKARPVAAAVKQLNIEIAFQLMNGVAQRRRRFIELRRGGGKTALFVEGIKNDEHIQQWFHRYPLTVRDSPLAHYSIGMTSGSGYWYSNPSSLQIRLPSTILPLPFSGLSENTGTGSPSSRAICG